MENSLPKTCRLCAETTHRLIEVNKEGDTSELAGKIEKYLHVSVSGCSLQICRPCRSKVERWGQFFEHVLRVQTCFDPLNGEQLISQSWDKITNNADISEPSFEDSSTGVKKIEEGNYFKTEISQIGDNDSGPATSDKENDQGCSDSTAVINQGADANPVQSSESDGQDESLKRSNSTAWQCHVCSCVLSSWKSLVKHCDKQHNTNPQFHCVCGDVLRTEGSIRKHYLKHERGLQFKCDTCSKSFHRKRLLQVHALSHLPKEEQPWICDTCHRRFHSKNLLKQHKLRHLPLDRKLLHPCEICEKNKWAAAAHKRNIHYREKLFVCDQCGLKFASKGVLDEHLIIHSNQFDYQCKDCGKMFKTKYRLKIHADTHLATRYACPVCNLSLNTRRTLRMHLLVHKDKKDFSCDTCGKGFKRSKDLKNHMNLHTGRRPYACQFCDRTFANGPNCRSHKLRIHREELKLLENSKKEVINEREETKALDSCNIEELHSMISSEEMRNCFDLQYPMMNFPPVHLTGLADG